MSYLKEVGASYAHVFKYYNMLNDFGGVIHSGMLVYFLHHAKDFRIQHPNIGMLCYGILTDGLLVHFSEFIKRKK